MFRIRYYTDMHGIDFVEPTEDIAECQRMIENWKKCWERDVIVHLDKMVIPAREIRYMYVEEV
jgi:hypothetical protein